MRGLLVHADERIQPPLLGVFVDLTLGSNKAGVQPVVGGVLGGELHPRKDGPQRPRALLLDALLVDCNQELVALVGPDVASQVGGPDAVLPSPWVVRPHHVSTQDSAGDRARSGAEPKSFSSASAISLVGPMPTGLGVAQANAAERF